MKMKEIRERLHDLAGQGRFLIMQVTVLCPKIGDSVEIGKLRDVFQKIDRLADETKKRRNQPRGPTKRSRVTDRIRQEVREYVAAHPNALQDEVGQHFNLDGGRVSEILHGKRK